jgi:hypothetical protein
VNEWEPPSPYALRCEVCGFLALSRQQLKEHKCQEHWYCMACKGAFETWNELRAHGLVRHPEVWGPFR